jgi:hypothetical protein
MRLVTAWGLSLLAALAACAAGQEGIHAPPTAGDAAAARGAARRSPKAVRVVRYDEPFALAFGRRVRVERSDTRARFVALVEDSRCPTGVQCIQAGRARVRLEVTRGSSTVGIELGTDGEASFASAGGVTWELQAVAPYPAAGRAHRPSSYVLTLVAHPLRNR